MTSTLQSLAPGITATYVNVPVQQHYLQVLCQVTIH